MNSKHKNSKVGLPVAMAGLMAAMTLAGCGHKDEIKAPAKKEGGGSAMPTLTQPAATAPAVPAPTAPTLAPETSADPAAKPVTEGLNPQQMADLENMTVALRRFFNVEMRVPKSLDEVVKAGYLTQNDIPMAPGGRKFAIDPIDKRVILVNK